MSISKKARPKPNWAAFTISLAVSLAIVILLFVSLSGWSGASSETLAKAAGSLPTHNHADHTHAAGSPVGILPEGNATAGEHFYFHQGCAGCHGDQGEGGYGPEIARTGLLFGQFLNQVRNPANPSSTRSMTAYTPGELSMAEVKDIYAFLKSLK